MTDYASVLEDKQDFMDKTDAAASGGGADLSSVSVLNVSPTTSVKKAGLYDPRKTATAATSEGLYSGRKKAMELAGVSFYDKPAYEAWDAKTRALMGVKKDDKFSSGKWMETFGSMKPDQINEAAGNVEYYLNDNLSTVNDAALNITQPVLKDTKHSNVGYGFPSINYKEGAPFSESPFSMEGIIGLSSGKLRPGGAPIVKTLPQADEFLPDYFNQLTEEYPGWRAPVGGSRRPTGYQLEPGGFKVRGETGTFQSGGSSVPLEDGSFGEVYDNWAYLEPSVAADPTKWSGSPYGTGVSGNVPGLVVGGVLADKAKYAGDPDIVHSFMPRVFKGMFASTGYEGSGMVDYDPTLSVFRNKDMRQVKDLIRFNKTALENNRKAGYPTMLEDHERFHMVNNILAMNNHIWSDVEFVNPIMSPDTPDWMIEGLKTGRFGKNAVLAGQTENLFNLLAPVTSIDSKTGKIGRTFDRQLLHIAIYSMHPDAMSVPSKYNNHSFFDDINNNDELDKISKMMARKNKAQALVKALNEASQLVMDAKPETIQKYHTDDWRWSSSQ